MPSISEKGQSITFLDTNNWSDRCDSSSEGHVVDLPQSRTQSGSPESELYRSHQIVQNLY